MKPLLALLIASAAYGQITCSTATSTSPCPVTAGGTTTLTATSSVTWSLAGNGSLSTAGPSLSTVYTAPSGVTVQHALSGCPAGPNDSVFYTAMNGLPLDANSSTKIGNMNTSGFSFEPAWGISNADSSTPLYTAIPSYGYPQVTSYARPNFGPNLIEENGDYIGSLNAYQTEDHHVMTVRHTDCQFFEDYEWLMYGATYSTSCGTLGTSTNCTSRGAQTYGPMQYTAVTGNVTAGASPLAPLHLSLSDLLSGAVNHIMEFTMGADFYGGSYLWPAQGVAGGSIGPTCTGPTVCVQLGDVLTLNSGYSNSTACTGTTIQNVYCNAILNGWKTYGLMPVDTGTHNAVIVDADIGTDPNVLVAINLIQNAGITPSQFSVRNKSTLEISATSYRVCPNGQSCLSGTNTTTTPLNSVTITGGSTVVPVAVQPITVGSTLPAELPIAAGTYTINLDSFAWTNPSTLSQARTWSVVSNSCSSGTLVVSGLLTVPTTGECVMVVQAASNVDGTNPLYLVLPIIPAPSGNLRIDTGATSNTTISGTTWYADTGAIGNNAGIYNYQNDNFTWPTSNPYVVVYESGSLNYGNDFRYTFGVPNGKYNVHMLFGVPASFSGCSLSPCGTWPGTRPQFTWNPSLIETQGNVVAHLDWNNESNYLIASPVDVYVPALVTNNILQIAADAYAPENGNGSSFNGPNYQPNSGNKLNQLSGVEILSVTTSPSLTIDPGFNAPNNLVAAAGSSQPFYAVFHYVAPSSVTWTASGQVCNQVGCTLSATPWGDGGEILSLASGTVNALQPITITASGGGYTATLTLYTSGSSVIVSP